MTISYLEDRGLRLTPKERYLNTPRRKEPPKLERSTNYDSSSGEKTPTSLIGSNEHLFTGSRFRLTYFADCFTILDILGEGSFGKVYKVRSQVDQNVYAVKVDKSRVRNNAHRNIKLEEVKRHEELSNHPNIVRLHHAWEERRIIYIQLELCETNLQILSQKHKLPEHDIWNILIDMLWALEHIHKQQFIHLDVKLENILVGFDGRYKLSDFGLVYNLSNKSGRDPLEGDAKYLAPELLNNSFTTVADVFSLGISILELAANVFLPNQGPVWHALRQDQMPREHTSHLSRELVSVISLMMTSNYLKRPAAEHILRHPFCVPYIRSWNQVLAFRCLKNTFLSFVGLLIVDPLTRMASVCSQAANYLFSRRDLLEIPRIEINRTETPLPGTQAYLHAFSQNSPFLHNTSTPHIVTAEREAIRELRILRQSPGSAVRRNLFSSFSSTDSDDSEYK